VKLGVEAKFVHFYTWITSQPKFRLFVYHCVNFVLFLVHSHAGNIFNTSVNCSKQDLYLFIRSGVLKQEYTGVQSRGKCSCLASAVLTRPRWGGAVQITGAWQSRKGPGAWLCCICFWFSWWYHCLLIAQTNRFRPSPSHSATDSQSYWFNVKIFSWSTLAWGPEKLFSLGPEPTLGGPVVVLCCQTTRLEGYETDQVLKRLNVFLESVDVFCSLCMTVFLTCKVRSVSLLTAGLSVQRFYFLCMFYHWKRWEISLVATSSHAFCFYLQFHFYMTWFLSRAGIA
jgi:hypothetical protein